MKKAAVILFKHRQSLSSMPLASGTKPGCRKMHFCFFAKKIKNPIDNITML